MSNAHSTHIFSISIYQTKRNHLPEKFSHFNVTPILIYITYRATYMHITHIFLSNLNLSLSIKPTEITYLIRTHTCNQATITACVSVECQFFTFQCIANFNLSNSLPATRLMVSLNFFMLAGDSPHMCHATYDFFNDLSGKTVEAK